MGVRFAPSSEETNLSSTAHRVCHRSPWLVAALIAAAAIGPAGCTNPAGNGLVPARQADNHSRALPANRTRAPRDGMSGGPSRLSPPSPGDPTSGGSGVDDGGSGGPS